MIRGWIQGPALITDMSFGDYYRYLREKGLPHNHAMGWVANIMGESSGRPDAIGDSGTSFGLNQWHGPRARALASVVPDWKTNWRGQLDYGLTEPDTAAYLARNFATPEDATEWFTRYWERPANQDRDVVKRIGHLGKLASQIQKTPQEAAMPIPQPQIPVTTDMQAMPAAARTVQTMSPWEDPMFWLSLAGGINPSSDSPFAGIAPSMAQYNKARLEQQLTQAKRNLQPSRIREVEALARTYGVSPEQAMRMVYPSGSQYGVTPRMQGGVMYEEFTLPGGERGYRMVDMTQQQARERVLTSEERAKGYGTAAGPEQVAYVKSIGEGAAANQSMLAETSRILGMFESGEMDKLTGPIRGHITGLYEPNARLLEAHSVRRVLDNLQIANLAPVSNYEIQLLRNMEAGIYATKEQNIAVLRELQRAQQKRATYFDDVSARLRKGETWEGILLDPPEVDFKPDKSLLPSGGGATTSPAIPSDWEMGSDGVIRRVR